jgi:hypothetical protein
VLPAHPDRLCDVVADSLVDQAARRERRRANAPIRDRTRAVIVVNRVPEISGL